VIYISDNRLPGWVDFLGGDSCIITAMSLTAEQRRALTLLVSTRDGCPEALFLAHGFTTQLIEALVAVGLVVTKREAMIGGGRTIEVTRLHITAAGRHALL
jgi:hypothetical protein